MTSVLTALAVLVVALFIALWIARQVLFHRLPKKVGYMTHITSQKLKEWAEGGNEPYTTWIAESNPEELFVRIIVHTPGNPKKQVLLLARLQSACKIIELIDHESDPSRFAAMNREGDLVDRMRHYEDTVSKWRGELRKYQVAVEQCFADIKAQL